MSSPENSILDNGRLVFLFVAHAMGPDEPLRHLFFFTFIANGPR